MAISGYGDVVDDLLLSTKAGIPGRVKEEIKTLLQKYYEEYKLYGKVKYDGDEDEIMKYSHKEMSHQFALVLNGIL